MLQGTIFPHLHNVGVGAGGGRSYTSRFSGCEEADISEEDDVTILAGWED